MRIRASSIVAGFLIVFLALSCAPREKMGRIIPMEDFFKNPERTSFTLSPSGEHFAFLQPWQSRLNVHVQKVGEETAVRITEATERDIVGYFWASDARIAYVQDKAGDENYRLYAVNIDGSGWKDLTPFEKVRVGLIDDLKDDDDHVLIAMNKRDARVMDAYRINVVDGEMEMIAENPGNIVDWQTDHAGRLRVATTSDGVNSSLLYRDDEKGPFETLATMSFKDALDPLFFTFDDKNLYVASNLGRDKQAIYEYDVKAKALTTLIYEHPEVDVDGLLRSDKRKIITGAAYFTDKRGYHFLDETRKKIQGDLEARLPGYEVVLADTNRDETKALVRTYSDRSLGAYYFYDMGTFDLKKIADVSPWINEAELAEMKPVAYTSRDGLTIHGYLTLPPGKKAKNLPAVINPHGGPWARDYWTYNPEVQFLANRGYAVLQMNFRTSTGYGKEFWEAGFKQWGLKIQDDISDGVTWLIKEGIADPKRVGIYGGSFGGYATLAGLTFTPELYACGVDYVGVANLFTFIKTFPPYWEPLRKMVYEMLGDPEKDKELYEKASPLFHAGNIRVPVLVAQGANDPRVNKNESDQMVEALKVKGIDVEYMVKDNEGHGFLLEENRFDFYRAMERFLGKHLGGRVEPTQAK